MRHVEQKGVHYRKPRGEFWRFREALECDFSLPVPLAAVLLSSPSLLLVLFHFLKKIIPTTNLVQF